MVQSTDKLRCMENFASYLANLPHTPLVEAVHALYESADAEFDPFADATDDQMVELTRRTTDYAVRLQPFGSNLLAENCVDNFYDIQDRLTGRNKSTVRCVHFTKSLPALLNILQYGIYPRKCIETSTTSIWMCALNAKTKTNYDRHTCVVFDIPADDSHFNLENNYVATYWRVIPPEWFVSVNFPVGHLGSSTTFSSMYAGNIVRRWNRDRIAREMADPNSPIRNYLDDESFQKLIQHYTGISV